jgi:hypothetical protein
LKIKVWLWLIWHNAIATKDIMSERGWVGNSKCQFCDQNESIHHLFFPVLLQDLCGAVLQSWDSEQTWEFFPVLLVVPSFLPASRNV